MPTAPLRNRASWFNGKEVRRRYFRMRPCPRSKPLLTFRFLCSLVPDGILDQGGFPLHR